MHGGKKSYFFFIGGVTVFSPVIQLVSICLSGEKANERRNAASATGHRGSTADGSAVPSVVRKSGVSGPCTLPGTESSEVPHSNIIVVSSPDTAQPEAGLYNDCNMNIISRWVKGILLDWFVSMYPLKTDL